VRRLSILAVSAFFVAFAASPALSTAAGREPAPGAKPEQRSVGAQFEKAERVTHVRASQRVTVNGLKRKLNRLITAHNELVDAHNALNACIGTMPVTQYFGYWYGFDGHDETALDFTEPGDTADVYMATWLCP
jgi:hypothetical protein